MSKICWLCKSNPADSREHKYKKSLLNQASFDKKDGKPFLVSFNKSSKGGLLQGPDAGIVKHGKTICVTCNGNRSQLWDKAYDKFTHFIITKKADPKFFDFNQIFSTNASENIKNLRNYYIKSLGCTLTDADFILPDNFPDPLTGNNLNQYHVTICWSHAAQRFLEDIADYAKCPSVPSDELEQKIRDIIY